MRVRYDVSNAAAQTAALATHERVMMMMIIQYTANKEIGQSNHTQRRLSLRRTDGQRTRSHEIPVYWLTCWLAYVVEIEVLLPLLFCSSPIHHFPSNWEARTKSPRVVCVELNSVGRDKNRFLLIVVAIWAWDLVDSGPTAVCKFNCWQYHIKRGQSAAKGLIRSRDGAAIESVWQLPAHG